MSTLKVDLFKVYTLGLEPLLLLRLCVELLCGDAVQSHLQSSWNLRDKLKSLYL
jgi:hypothetical protein